MRFSPEPHAHDPNTAAKAGFALVEALAAMVILAIVVLAISRAMISSTSVVSSSKETQRAVHDLRAAAESALALQIDDMPISGSEFEHGQQISRFNGLHLKDERIVATYPGYTPGDPVPNPLTLQLTAQWTDNQGRQRSMGITTVKSK